MGVLRIAWTEAVARLRGKAGVAIGLAAAAGALGALIALPVAVEAAAGGGLVYDHEDARLPTSPGDPDGRTQITARCPDSHPQVTGGGVAVAGEDPDLEVGSTFPSTLGKRTGWTGAGNNDTGTDSSMTVKVICAKGDFSRPERDKPNPQGDQVQAGIDCPKGTKLTGGGVLTEGDHSVEVASTEPADGGDKNSKPDDRWVGSANDGAMTVRAVCAKTGAYRYVKSKRSKVADGEQQQDIVDCPNGTSVTGGGIDISGISDDLEVGGSFPAGNGWVGRAINDSSGHDETMQVFAICKV